MRDPLMKRGMIEIGQIEPARDHHRISFVDAEAEGIGERDAGQRKGENEAEREAAADRLLVGAGRPRGAIRGR